MTIRFLFTLIYLLFFARISASQTQAEQLKFLDNKEKKELIKRISADYSNWGQVELNGKLHIEFLPVSPSVKIFMNRGKELFITVRAPFVGEVARVEADKDSILLVNKLKHTYCKEDLQSVARITTITLGDIQDLLLDRMFIAGRGTLNEKHASRIDFYAVEGNGWLAVPQKETDDDLITYGFVISPDYKMTQLIVQPIISDSSGEILFEKYKKNTSLDFTFKINDKTYDVGLTYGNPKWGAKPFERMEFNSKYRRLGIRDFIKTAF